MKVVEKNLMRLVAVQQLRSVHGIKTKNWNKNKATSSKSTANSANVFGIALDNLPYYNMECGRVPGFLVDACMKLQAHVETEGLFRKSGSVLRLKALKAKLELGEECISTALPCDVAGLVKQFFRELPEPVMSTELQEAFLKAQQLNTQEEKTSAIMLLSCLLPDKSIPVLRYFFDFLHNVSLRSAENKMDSANLSVILAPNLFHFGDGGEKMNANTEKRLKLQAAIVQCFIENANSFGVLPDFLQERIPAMLGCEGVVSTPTHIEFEEPDSNQGGKRKQRRSFGDVFNGAMNKIKTNRTPTKVDLADSLVFSSATPVIATPSSKRKLPLESGHSMGFSSKKRRSIKKNLGLELLSNTLFSGTSTPASGCSASTALDSSANSLLSTGNSRRKSAPSGRRRRLSSRIVNRVESGRTGCFSPKVSKKEPPRKSMRLRFNLGKSSKDAGSVSIGLRLAKQESDTSFHFTDLTGFSPSRRPRKTESQDSRYKSKSEDNLLTPRCQSGVQQTSWNAETPVGGRDFSHGLFTDTPVDMCTRGNYVSEPAITLSKPAAGTNLPMKLCCALSAESLDSGCSSTETLRQIDFPTLKTFTASTESVRNLHTPSKLSGSITDTPTEALAIKDYSVESDTASPQSKEDILAKVPELTLCGVDAAPLTPLHIDSVLFEPNESCSPRNKSGSSNVFSMYEGASLDGLPEIEIEQINCSRLIDALDIQSPVRFKRGVSVGLQSTPNKTAAAVPDKIHPPADENSVTAQPLESLETPPKTRGSVQKQAGRKPRVADHIQHFNKLTLNSPPNAKTRQIRSPLQFQRTPVRQTVCRINSLLGESRRPRGISELAACQGNSLAKALSLESGISPRLLPGQRQPHAGLSSRANSLKNPPPVPPKKHHTLDRTCKSSALGDVTNKAQPKMRADLRVSEFCEVKNQLLQQVTEKDLSHYRGSPRNPLNQGGLLSATKPLDL